jgi:hypothetical protein
MSDFSRYACYFLIAALHIGAGMLISAYLCKFCEFVEKKYAL